MIIKKFKQFNSDQWIGPVKILNNVDNLISTNLGNYQNKSESKLTIGYSYILRVINNEIVETGMSCVDLVILVKSGAGYEVLSIKRGRPPFVGMWANPGGNIDEGEQPIDAAVRELEEETGLALTQHQLTYVGAFDKPWRDPRNKNCVSHAFVVLLESKPNVTAGDDATECTWNFVDSDGNVNAEMAFDHSEVIKKSISCI